MRPRHNNTLALRCGCFENLSQLGPLVAL